MRRFLIPTLLAAGFMATQSAKALPPGPDSIGPDQDRLKTLKLRLQLQHKYSLAGHRSHSSHSSHSSHRSSSGGGRSYSSPSPSYAIPDISTRNLNSTPPSSILPSPPAAAPLRTLPGNSDLFQDIVRRVQLALTSYGYYTGPIDGILGRQGKAAISKFQSDYKLKVTGTITPEVLDAFGIQASR